MSRESRIRVGIVAGVSALGLLAPPAAMAQEGETEAQVAAKSYDESVVVNASDLTFVTITKDISVSKSIAITGLIKMLGELITRESAMSTIDDKQIINDNFVSIDSGGNVDNSVSVGAAALSSTDGNISLNVSAGDSNVQDNATVISMVEPTTAGAGDASIFTLQKSFNNEWADGVNNRSATNSASLLDDVLSGASGNVGVNAAAGAFNGQENGLAVAFVIGSTVLAEASAGGIQETTQNTVFHAVTTNVTEVGNSVLADSSGTMTLNVVTGNNNLQANSTALSIAQ